MEKQREKGRRNRVLRANRLMTQSGSTFLHTATTSFMMASKRSSSASMVIFWVMKLTVASWTPSIFLMAVSILAAQLAQPRFFKM